MSPESVTASILLLQKQIDDLQKSFRELETKFETIWALIRQKSEVVQ
jgi:hypothetical protein